MLNEFDKKLSTQVESGLQSGLTPERPALHYANAAGMSDNPSSIQRSQMYFQNPKQLLPNIVLAGSLTAQAPVFESPQESAGLKNWGADYMKGQFRMPGELPAKPDLEIAQSPHLHKRSPFGSSREPERKNNDERKSEPQKAEQKTENKAPVPVLSDADVRAGKITLETISNTEASQIIAAAPELFLAEGKRELKLLTAADDNKPQVYVSQNPADTIKNYPGYKVYGSIQEAVNKAPSGSVINVLPGKSTQAVPKGVPYTENVTVGRSDIVIRTNDKLPAVVEGGGFSIGNGVKNVKILNFDFREFSERDSAIRVEGENISNIVVGGNYFYSARGAEAAGFYGTGKGASSAIQNVYLMANVIGQDRQGNSLPIKISAKQLEATPFNGNVSGINAIGNLYFGTSDSLLNLGLDFIGGENVGSGENNRARNGFAAYNYGRHIGHPSRWASGVGYVDGASNIVQVLNMSDSSNFCGEIGAERPNTTARNNAFSGNVCKDSKNHWISVGAPENNGAAVSGSTIENNIVIGRPDTHYANIQNNPGISRQELNSKNQFYKATSEVTKLPRQIVELYRFHRKP